MKKFFTNFSKFLLLQESALIWVETLCILYLSYLCITLGYAGTLPWIAVLAAFPWTAYGVSQAFYYKKSEKENQQGGIVYDLAIKDTDQPTI